MVRQERYKVDFQVFIAWQDAKGVTRRASGRCVDLSASGAKVETRDHFPARTMVLVSSDSFGRMGNAIVRYCLRVGMKYYVGLQFSALMQLGDPVRQKILEKVIVGQTEAQGTDPA